MNIEKFKQETNITIHLVHEMQFYFKYIETSGKSYDYIKKAIIKYGLKNNLKLSCDYDRVKDAIYIYVYK